MFNNIKNSNLKNAFRRALTRKACGLAVVVAISSFCLSAYASSAHVEKPLPGFFEFIAERKIFWINFIVYIVLLSYVLKKVFVKAWAARRSAYQESITSGKKLLEDSQKKLIDAQHLMAGLPSEVESLRARMTKDAESEAKNIVQYACDRADKIRNQASQSAAVEKRAAFNSYQDQLIELAMKRAKSKVAGMISEDVDSRLKNKVVSSVGGLLN